MDAIERNARLQSRLIEELLDMSRIIAGNVRLELRQLDAADTVEEVVASLQPVAQAKGVAVDAHVARDAGALMADPDRLQQIVWNLLSNAIKFTPPGQAVHVQLRREDAELVLTVADEGEGIAPSFLPHVFERFRQADGSA